MIYDVICVTMRVRNFQFIFSSLLRAMFTARTEKEFNENMSNYDGMNKQNNKENVAIISMLPSENFDPLSLC